MRQKYFDQSLGIRQLNSISCQLKLTCESSMQNQAYKQILFRTNRRKQMIPHILYQLSRIFGDGPLTNRDCRQITDSCSSLSFFDQMRVWTRLICLQPILKAINQYIPTTPGRIIDLGSGYGVLSWLLASSRKQEILGIEVSLPRLAIAQQITKDIQNLTFEHGDIANIAVEPSSTILLIDVLCLFPIGTQQRILFSCADSLTNNGILLLKDNTTIPKWKFHYASLEERVKLFLGIYSILTLKQPNYLSPDTWRNLITRSNLKIRDEFLVKSLAPYPGIIYICQKSS